MWRHSINFIITVTFFVTANFYNSVFAQGKIATIEKTLNYVKRLDSICKLESFKFYDMGYSSLIEEGTIYSRDTIPIGGYSITTLSDIKDENVFKIEYHDNVNVNIYKTYYFLSNELVYAKLELHENSNDLKKIYYKEEFYKNGNIIRTTTRKDKNAKKYSKETNVLLYKDGLSLLSNFKKKNYHPF